MNSCNWKYTFPLYNFLVPYLRQIIQFGQIKLVAQTIGKLISFDDSQSLNFKPSKFLKIN